MAILAETLEKLLQKAGVDTSSEDFSNLIQKKELLVEIPDTINQSLTSLMSLNEAKNNHQIKSHFKAEALDPFNNKITTWLTEHGVDEATAKQIAEDNNTYNKVEVAIRKIAELKEKQNGSNSKGQTAELERKINELSAQLSKTVSDAQREKEEAINSIRSQYDNEFTEMQINQIISSKPLPGQFGSDIETKIAREFLNKKLAEKNATIKKVDGKIKIVAKDDEKLLIFDNGKELDLDTLTNMALAENKFIKVSDQSGGTPPKSPQGTPPKTNQATKSAIDEINRALEGFES
jgi:tRNA nucleotidyltransferase/poly(A) polymerase